MIRKMKISRMRSSSTLATVVATIIFHFLVATASPAPQGIPLPVMIRMMAMIMRVLNVMLMQMNNDD